MFDGAKTILGIVIAFAPSIATLFGFDTSPDFTGDATEIVSAVIALLGSALAIYGRAKAKGPMWFTRKP